MKVFNKFGEAVLREDTIVDIGGAYKITTHTVFANYGHDITQVYTSVIVTGEPAGLVGMDEYYLGTKLGHKGEGVLHISYVETDPELGLENHQELFVDLTRRSERSKMVENHGLNYGHALSVGVL